jgi:hypothetical protein
MTEEFFDSVRKEFLTLPELLAVLADPSMFAMLVSGSKMGLEAKLEYGGKIVEPMAVYSIRIWQSRANKTWTAEIISRAVIRYE